MNELPTIKKRRTDTKPQRSEIVCDEYRQSFDCSQEGTGDVWNAGCGGCVEENFQKTRSYKLASTLKFQQRSDSSQCRLAWNVPSNIQPRVASVTDIHLQMMSKPENHAFAPATRCLEEMEHAWIQGGSEIDVGVRGKSRERWVPLQNAKERLT